MFQKGCLDIETVLNLSEMGDTKEILRKLIDFGALKDPNAPRLDIASALRDAGVRFNMSVNDINTITPALEKAQQLVEQYNQQAAAPESGIQIEGMPIEQQPMNEQALIEAQLQTQTPLDGQEVPPEQQVAAAPPVPEEQPQLPPELLQLLARQQPQGPSLP